MEDFTENVYSFIVTTLAESVNTSEESYFTTTDGYTSESTTLNFTINNTALNNSAPLSIGQKAYRLVIPVISMCVILLNGAVILSSGLILKRNLQPRTTYLFLGNIALCDLVTAVTVVFGSVYPKEWREFWMCRVQLGMIIASTLASVWSVGLVALDRFFYIIHGIKYNQWVYGSRVRLLIFSSWVFAIAVGFSPTFQWEFGKLPKQLLKCWLVKLTPKPILAVIVILAVLPLFMNFTLYLIILYYALRRIVKLTEANEKGSSTVNDMRISRSASRKTETKSSKNEVLAKWKAIKVVAFTTGAYMFTFVPYVFTCFLYVTCQDPRTCDTIGRLIASPLAILVFVNSLLNPIIYAWWHKPFRRNAVNLLLRKNQISSRSGPSTVSTATSSRSSGNLPEMTHL